MTQEENKFMNEEIEINNKIDSRIRKLVPQILQNSSFSDRKLTDTPLDAFQVVSRKYVNLNGILANRPNSSVATIGQSYFATDTNIPMRFDGSRWRDGVGSVIA